MLHSYGFVIDKNLDNYFGIDVAYADYVGAEFCNSDIIDGGCRYYISSYEINSKLLHMIHVWISKNPGIPIRNGDYLAIYKQLPTSLAESAESRLSFYSALVHYRFLMHDSILQAMEKSKFRELKRIYSTETKPERKLSQQWAIA